MLRASARGIDTDPYVVRRKPVAQVWVSPLLPEFLREHLQTPIEAQFSNAYADLLGEGARK